MFHQPRITIEHTVAEDIEVERHRVYAAFAKMREQIERMTEQGRIRRRRRASRRSSRPTRCSPMTKAGAARINEAIDSGLTAEAAIERVQQRTRMRMREIDDPLLRDRMHDLEDLANRLLRIVSGQLGTAAQMGLRQDSILIARNLGPAELLEYDRRRLKGVILEEGSLTAHVTIVARAMGVPVLGRVRDIRRLDQRRRHAAARRRPGDRLFIRPTTAMEEAFEAELALSQKRRAAFAALRDKCPP